MKKAIVILDYHEYPKKILKKIEKKLTIIKYNPRNQVDLKKFLIKKSKKFLIFAVVAKLGLKFDKKLIKHTNNNLKYLLSPTTGLNHVDVEELSKNNVKIIYLKNKKFLASISSTAEHAWSLILAITKNLKFYDNSIFKKKKWDRGELINSEIQGKTLGIIGYGRLGKILAKYARVFKMKIFICDKKKVKLPKYIKNISLNKIFEKSDIITINLSYENNNKKIINSNILKKSKRNLIIINTSRGELIDQEYLFKMLKENKIKFAGLDVLQDDSTWNKKIPKEIVKNLNLLKSKLIVTPHVGGFSEQAVIKTREHLINNFIKVL